MRPLSRPGKKAPLWLLVMITISGTLAMHMFVPALPAVGRDFGASIAAMQLTISVYILGLAGGQLVYGPLSDALGRRPLLIVGLGLYVVAGLAAAVSTNVHTLVTARLFQALGGCAGLVLGRAIVRDTASAGEAVRDLALLNLVMMIGPGLAPLMGSLLVVGLGWRSIFVALAALGAVTFLFSWRLLPETGRPTGRLKAGTLLRDYRALLRSPSFVGFAIGGGCTTTSIYAFIAAAPFIISTQLHRPLPEVGLYLGLLMMGMALGNAITRYLASSVALERLLVTASGVSVLSALALLAVVLLGDMTVVDAIGLMFLFAVGAGAASPAALTKALGVDTRLVGSAAGLYGFTQMAVGALCTSLVGIGQGPALAAAAILTAAAVLGQAGFWVALRCGGAMPGLPGQPGVSCAEAS
ncbi:MAG: Bcr/CflA family efflux MFS transporter [Burkholderiaceae bacterium]|nr:MAG: Bcr/CflA family efflux MFS transporter [Burkholderiaceae bacterium]TBR75437.1 MAG: Bcr/CflA family efflux MFS transporter [Burkholderiaceae bacterium]